jgi:hypothetical protein
VAPARFRVLLVNPYNALLRCGLPALHATDDILKTAICFENRPRDALESFARRINDEPFSR